MLHACNQVFPSMRSVYFASSVHSSSFCTHLLKFKALKGWGVIIVGREEEAYIKRFTVVN